MSKLDEARLIINQVDGEMAKLFEKRMKAAEAVYEYKKEFGLPILDSKREEEVIEKNTNLIQNQEYKGYSVNEIASMLKVGKGEIELMIL